MPLYNITNVFFLVFTIACAVSSNLNMLIGFRFLAGIAGSAAVTMGGGTVADLFIPQQRGRAMAIWSMGPLIGPVAVGHKTFMVLHVLWEQRKRARSQEAFFARPKDGDGSSG